MSDHISLAAVVAAPSLGLALCLVDSGHLSTQTRMHLIDRSTCLKGAFSALFPAPALSQQALLALSPRSPLTTPSREAFPEVSTSVYDCDRALWTPAPNLWIHAVYSDCFP